MTVAVRDVLSAATRRQIQVCLTDCIIPLSIFKKKSTMVSYQNHRAELETVDNNDTVSYGCIRVALELQPSVKKCNPRKRS